MKVYLMGHAWPYEATSIYHVCSTKKLTEKRLKELKKECGNEGCSIEKWDVEEE